jgi:lipopolysaccharide export system permease protein
MLPPVVSLSLMTLTMAAFLGFIGSPWGNRSFKDLIFQIAHSKADLAIKERVFCEPFDGVTFYINSFSSKERVMEDVFLVDKRDPELTNTIVAREGRVFSHPTSKIITVHFFDGTIFMVDKDLEDVRTIDFKTYDLNIGLQDIMPALSGRRKAPKEMFVRELIETVKTAPKGDIEYNEAAIELMERFAIPLAVFFMGIIGMPLGAQIRSGGRLIGVVISLVVFLIYYMFLAGIRSFGETGTVSPFVGPWVPDLFLVLSCVYLLRRAGRERSIHLFDRVLAPQER